MVFNVFNKFNEFNDFNDFIIYPINFTFQSNTLIEFSKINVMFK